MKKAALSFLFLLLFGSSSAQSNVVENRALGDVTLRYCNDSSVEGGTKYVLLSGKAGENIPICLLMNNGGSKPVAIGLNFVDGTTTADEQERKACQPEEQRAMFGQYITGDDTAFIIPARGSLKTELKANFPIGYAGLANGCITAHLLSGATTTGGMFNIFSRLGYFIDILIDGDYKLDMGLSGVDLPYHNYSNNPQLPIYDNIIKNTFESVFVISNTGNVPAIITVKSTTSRRRGYQTYQNSFTGSVLPQQNRKIEDFMGLGRYKYLGGPVNYKLEINTIPQKIGPVLPLNGKSDQVSYQADGFLTPWPLLIVLGLIIGYIFIRSSRKKIVSIQILVLLCLGSCVVTSAQASCLGTDPSCNQAIGVSVRIYNSYTGSLLFANTGSFVVKDNLFWTNQDYIDVAIQASKPVSYLVSGSGVQTNTGTVTGIIQDFTYLQFQTDGLKVASISFDSSGEYLTGNTINRQVDRTPPTQTQLSGPVDNSILAGTGIDFSWSVSQDTGVGLSGYTIELSLNGSWSNPILISLTGEQFNLHASGRPVGTYFWRVKSIDKLGNTSVSYPGFFHLGAPSVVNNAYNQVASNEKDSFDVLIHDPLKSINPQETLGCSTTPNGTTCSSNVIGLHSSSIDADSPNIVDYNLQYQLHKYLQSFGRSNIQLPLKLLPPKLLPESGVDVDPSAYVSIIKKNIISSCASSSGYNYYWIILAFLLGVFITKQFSVQQKK